MPFFVQEHLHGDAVTFGMIWTTFALGTILGSLASAVMPTRGKWFQAGSPQLFLLYSLQGLMIITFATSSSAVWAYLLFGSFGLINGLVNVMLTTVLQQRTPNEQLGRVSSLANVVNALALTVSFALAGWLGTYLGAAEVIGGGGALLLGASAVAWGISRVKR